MHSVFCSLLTWMALPDWLFGTQHNLHFFGSCLFGHCGSLEWWGQPGQSLPLVVTITDNRRLLDQREICRHATSLLPGRWWILVPALGWASWYKRWTRSQLGGRCLKDEFPPLCIATRYSGTPPSHEEAVKRWENWHGFCSLCILNNVEKFISHFEKIRISASICVL